MPSDLKPLAARAARKPIAAISSACAPDLIIEVLSPATASDDRGLKYDLYEKNGVREYWLVDPDAHYVEVYVNRNGHFNRQGVFVEGKSFTSEVLGGRAIEVDRLFG